MIDDEAKMARQTPVAMAPTTSQQRCVQRWLLSVYLSISIRSIDENSWRHISNAVQTTLVWQQRKSLCVRDRKVGVTD